MFAYPTTERTNNLNSPDPAISLFKILVVAGILQVTASVFFVNWLDLSLFFTWAQGLYQGFFNAYDGHVQMLDYPPGYFLPLWLIGALSHAIDLEIISESLPLVQLIMKFLPILYNLGCALMVYKIACLFSSEEVGLNAVTIWLVSPAILINCVWWGQIDTLLMLMLMASYYLLEKDRPYAATIVFAFSCVTKFQTCFFLPVFVAAMLFKQPIKKTVFCGFIGAAVCFGVFLPFMLSYGSVLLPLHLYTKSYGSYPYVTLYAYNIYGIWNLNRVNHTQPIIQAIPWLTYLLVGRIATILSLLSPFVIYLINKLRRVQTDMWVVCFVVMQTIFMFATMMHERYQIVVLPFLMALYLKYKDKRWLYLFAGITAVLAVSETHVMLIYVRKFSAWWLGAGGNIIQSIFSVLNLLIYLLSMVLSFQYLFGDGQQKSISRRNPG